MIWGPLASGYLSGKFQKGGDVSHTRIGARGTAANALDNEHNRRILSAVEDIAVTRGVSFSQVALNWVARRPGVATIIIGFGFYHFIGSEMMPLADVGQAYGGLTAPMGARAHAK